MVLIIYSPYHCNDNTILAPVRHTKNKFYQALTILIVFHDLGTMYNSSFHDHYNQDI